MLARKDSARAKTRLKTVAGVAAPPAVGPPGVAAIVYWLAV